MQENAYKEKVRASLPSSDDSIFDRLLDRVWDRFDEQRQKDHMSNQLFVLADVIFREELSPKSIRRLPVLTSHSLRLLREDFEFQGQVEKSFYGIFTRTYDRNSPMFIEDPNASLNIQVPVSLVAYRAIVFAYLTLVVQNDALPRNSQLTKPELLLIRDAFLGERALTNQIATTVERKFQVSLFRQANLVLKLYKSSDKGWSRQEQKLFYEEFILNFGVRRRYPLDDAAESRLKELLLGVESLGDYQEAFDELESVAGIHMLGYFRTGRHFSRFLRMGLVTRSKVSPRFNELFPMRRWRPVCPRPSEVGCLMREHVSEESIKVYLMRQISACFVILRAHGKTGFEAYIGILLRWLRETFDVDLARHLPEIYYRSLMRSHSIEDVLNDVYAEHIAQKAQARLSQLTVEEITNATLQAVHRMGTMTLKSIAPGHYDFGAFVYDVLFDLKYPAPEYSFLIHRIN